MILMPLFPKHWMLQGAYQNITVKNNSKKYAETSIMRGSKGSLMALT